MKPTLLILAAGMGSRYGGLKQVDQVGPSGETIIDYSIHDAIGAGFGKIVLVVRESILAEMKDIFDTRWGGKINIEYAIQEVDVPVDGIDNIPERKKPWGTAHAVMVAKPYIHEPFAVINADDFYGQEAFASMNDFLTNGISDSVFSMVGYILKNTLSEHGFVSRGVSQADDDNFLLTVTERTHIERIEGDVIYKSEDGTAHSLDENCYVSMNFWGFTPVFFDEAEAQFKDFVKSNDGNEKAEFYIPFVVENIMQQQKTRVKVLDCPAKWMGITYKQDKPVVTEKVKALVDKGIYPNSLFD